MKNDKEKFKNFAFIDSQNLYLSIKEDGWQLDYKRFRVYLKEKYKIEKAYMFLGYLAENQELYKFLQEAGFILIFKPILEKDNLPIKGNCDVDLTVYALVNNEYDKAVIITGDGDFYALVEHLKEQGKLARVLAPSHKNCSVLLRKAAGSDIAFISDLKQKLEYKKKSTPQA